MTASLPGETESNGAEHDDVNEVWRKNFDRETLDERRFSVAELLAVIAMAAVVLSVTRWFDMAVAAAVLGLIVLVTLTLLAGPHPRMFRLAWWVLLALYVIVACAAVFDVQ